MKLIKLLLPIAVMGCEPDIKLNDDKEDVKPTTSKVIITDNDVAQDAANIIREYFALGRRVASSEFKLSTCHDETVGFANVVTCIERSKQVVDEAAEKVVAFTNAKFYCGKEIENNHKNYILGRKNSNYHKELIDWMNNNRSRIEPIIKNKSLTGMCRDHNVCQPAVLFEKHFEPNYGIIGNTECTKKLFQCGSIQNVCWINKVADRLGVGESLKKNDLKVKATGKAIN